MTENNNTTKKAVTAKVNLGFAVIDGLMLPNGDFAVAVPQLAEIFGTSKNTFSRDLKRLLGDSFNPSSVATDIGKQRINIISLADVTQVIRALEKKGNAIASAFTDAILQEGLDRRFNRAFDLKTSEDEYNERIKFRVLRVETRLEWTDVLMKRHIELFGCKPAPKQYAYWTKRVNMSLFGQPNFNYDRDTMTKKQQQTIQHFEICAVRWSEQNPKMDCEELLEMMLARY